MLRVRSPSPSCVTSCRRQRPKRPSRGVIPSVGHSSALPQLIPAPPTHATLRPSVASKRDHDEWLARRGSGDGEVVPLQAESRSARSGSPGTPLLTRGAAPCGTVPGGQAATHEAAAETGLGRTSGPPFATDCTVFAMRHGMRPSRPAIRPKPRSAGEARASFHLRTTRVGPAPRRPRFLYAILRGP